MIPAGYTTKSSRLEIIRTTVRLCQTRKTFSEDLKSFQELQVFGQAALVGDDQSDPPPSPAQSPRPLKCFNIDLFYVSGCAIVSLFGFESLSANEPQTVRLRLVCTQCLFNPTDTIQTHVD